MTSDIPQPRRPELLAPAGDHECLRAAIENGADAVYFGLEDGFNARARATNFDLAGLPAVMDELHERGVQGFVTLNTLAFTDELPRLEQIIRRLALASVDAVLVQDLGVARLVREITSDLTLHASTQMTLSSAECMNEAANLGIRRVVLPRELSIEEIREVRQGTRLELEVFVHGALCVAYSGQCLTSESLGGRSANRGQCAQACRLPYELLCDGELQATGQQKYLLSPQDLAAYPLTAELIAAGVDCFKIEGRLKSAEYVANATRHYRDAINQAVAGRRVEFPLRRVQELEQSFSRGFSPGWLQGCDHKMLVPATSSAKRGVLLGTVQRVDGPRVAVELQYVVRPGDGVVFDGDRMAGDEQGGRVFEIFRNGWRVEDEADRGCVELTFDSTAIDLHRLSPGQRIWKTDDPQLNRRLQQTFRTADPIRRVPLRLNVSAAVGQPLRVNGRTDTGRMCSAESSAPLAEARKHPLTEAVLREQFARLGGTVFELAELRAAIVGSPMAPLSVLGQVRRELLRQLATSVFVEPELAAVGATDRLRAALKAGNPQPPAGAPELVVMCRTLSQLESLAATRGPGAADELIADFQDPREHRAAIDAAQRAGRRLLIATPRIQKPGEIGLFRTLLKLGPEAVLIRNLAGLAFFRDAGVAVAGDYSLNVTNELTAGDLMQRGLQWLTPSYDLNREQLFDLVQAVPPAWLEVVMHQHMPMFHMEHCVFCAMLSPGTNKTNCGRPCDVHQVELRDRTGVDHPLVADVGCRNTLFNSVAQSSAEVVSGLLAAGVRRFRIELLRETPDEAARLVGTYRSLLTGGISGTAVWQQLNAMNRVGVTRGTLEPRRNPLAIL